jgi:hypothetical protein
MSALIIIAITPAKINAPMAKIITGLKLNKRVPTTSKVELAKSSPNEITVVNNIKLFTEHSGD